MEHNSFLIDNPLEEPIPAGRDFYGDELEIPDFVRKFAKDKPFLDWKPPVEVQDCLGMVLEPWRGNRYHPEVDGLVNDQLLDKRMDAWGSCREATR